MFGVGGQELPIIAIPFVIWVAIAYLIGRGWARRGRNFTAGFLLSLIPFIGPIVAILLGILIPPNKEKLEEKALKSGEMVKCPFCAELIKPEAKVCRYCGKDVS